VIRTQLADAIRTELLAMGLEVEGPIHLEQPAQRAHGDWSSNVAMANAKRVGRPPRDLAMELVERLNASSLAHVERVEVAGPGFVNFHLRPTWLHEVLASVVAAGQSAFGRSSVGEGVSVNVEFVSANPTGPLHAGHARGATFGDAVARVLEWAGYSVSREFYINDRGSQMVKMGESILARAHGEEPPEGGYAGAYIADWAASLAPEAIANRDVAAATEHGYRCALADQQEVLGQLGIIFDTWFSERSLVESGAIEAALADLGAAGALRERDGATWLASSEHGDEKDRVLIKSDGALTYLTPDIAYHRDKFSRNFDVLIDVWGADHHGYIARMRAAMIFLGHSPDQLDVRITQLVKLMKAGAEVKISKRTGDIIELRDIIEEIGPDATRLVYLMQSVDSPMTVDLAVIAEQSMENPVFYIQMAHARLCSIARMAQERGVVRAELVATDLSPLTHDRELEVLRLLNAFAPVVELAARERAPHKVATWLRELAGEVHGFYHDCPILRDDVEEHTRQARLWLAEAGRIGLAVGLHVLGASAPESM
jgi:arginyl-tRNA synthetase